ncbi:hypothetical protein, partial [Senegalimassilia faecalis]|uniref:hypothetical protein n=1 Tax=Senegalimassilia faecalis TaxID=2509433 RepID=UPI00307726AA
VWFLGVVVFRGVLVCKTFVLRPGNRGKTACGVRKLRPARHPRLLAKAACSAPAASSRNN